MGEINPVAELLEDHFERYPDMDAEDVYKLLHQAVLGPGHVIVAPALALDALLDESRVIDLEVLEHEEVIEHLLPERGTVRVHLRPYLRSGGDLHRLHEAFVRSAEVLGEPDTDALQLALAEAITFLDGHPGIAVFSSHEFRALVLEQRRAGFTPLSHSEDYKELYAPAYRVLLLSELTGDAPG